MMLPNAALLSIHKEYTDLIFDGTKRVELRKVRPRNLESGDIIIVYETSPRKSIVGVLEVDKIIEKPPKSLWKIVRHKAGLSYQDYSSYYKNSSIGVAIFFRNVSRFETPLDLDTLKKEWSNFHPPQCYKYLSTKELKLVQSMTRFDFFSFSQQNSAQFCQIELELFSTSIAVNSP